MGQKPTLPEFEQSYQIVIDVAVYGHHDSITIDAESEAMAMDFAKALIADEHQIVDIQKV